MNNIGFPFFSIIIPCYNAVAVIDKALQSLELQTFCDLEVILVDDCSTDNTYEYCERKIASYNLNIILLRNEVNSGPGVSRNKGLQHARGKYVGFCDSDDWYGFNLLELVYKKIAEEESDIIFFDAYRCFSENNRKQIGNLSQYCYCKNKEDFVALSTDSLWSLIAKRDIFQKVSIANLYNAEDVVTVPLLIIEAKRISYINLPLYNYQYRLQSLSTFANQRVVNNFLEAYSFLTNHWKAEYDDAFECLCIKLVLYGVFYNAVRSGVKREFLNKQLDEFQKNYPDWYKNRYMKYFPMRKKIWMFLVKNRWFLALYLYCVLQKIYLRSL